MVVSLLSSELIGVTRQRMPAAEPPQPRQVDGTPLKGAVDGKSIVVSGPPGQDVLVLADGQPLTVVILDEHGSATARGVLAGRTEALITLTSLASGHATVDRPARATATRVVIQTVTVTPTTTPTVRRTSTPKATATTTATATVTVTATSTGIPSPSPTRTTAPPTRIPSPPTTAPTASAELLRTPPPVLHLIHDAGPRLAVTFDGGASSNGTAALLDLLDELQLKVTMFVTGEFIEREPHLVRRALLEGHEIGNHTYSHPHLTSYADDKIHRLLPHVTREWFEDQLMRTERAFVHATGRSPAPFWRAPYGEENRNLRRWAADLGYLHVRWSSVRGASLDSWDWVNDEHSGLYQDSQRMMKRLLGFPRLEGGIVLMHLASERSEPSWKVLPSFLEALDGRGIEVVTVSQLLHQSATWRPWLETVQNRLDQRMVAVTTPVTAAP